jgi:VCBS repeat-containing protein
MEKIMAHRHQNAYEDRHFHGRRGGQDRHDRHDDSLTGTDGDDVLIGRRGDDTMTGGAGSDLVIGNAGDDTAIYVVADNAGARDVYNGGHGDDTLVLVLTADEWADATVQADVLRFLSGLGASGHGCGGGRPFDFTAFDLRVQSFENLTVIVDGIEIDPTNQLVTAIDDTAATDEDTAAVFGSVLGNDSAPDGVALIQLVSGPASGTLNFNTADGSYSFDPAGDFDDLAAGESRIVAFTYRVTDTNGDSDEATVTITVTGTNDAPIATAFDAGSASEDDAPLNIDLLSTASDVDSADLDVANVTVTASDGRVVSFTVDPATGLLTLDPGQFIDLDDADSVVLTIAYDVTDGDLSVPNTATLTITGALELISGTNGNDNPLNGTEYGDLIRGEVGNDLINAGDGDDSVLGGAGVDTIYGGNGNDTLNGNLNPDRLFGGDGGDQVFGGHSNDVLHGDAGNDTLDGGDGWDGLHGGDGDDRLIGGAGPDRMSGNAGNDVFVLSDLDGVDNDTITDFTVGEDSLELNGLTVTGASVVNADGDGLADDIVLTFDNGATLTMLDTAGQAVVAPAIDAGSHIEGTMLQIDLLDGAQDALLGGDLDIANVSFSASNGADLAALWDPETGSFAVNLANFNGLASGENVTVTVTYDVVSDYGATTSTTATFEVNGSDDNLITDGGAGTAAADRILGTVTADTINGGAGNDTFVLAGGDDIAHGDDGNDLLNGQQGDDELYGDAGDDVLRGNRGFDTLFGGDGNDQLDGGADNDRLNGGAGENLLSGGDGADEFVFDAANGITLDTITDFEIGADVFDLVGLSIASFAATDADGDGLADDTLVVFDSGALVTLLDATISSTADLY